MSDILCRVCGQKPEVFWQKVEGERLPCFGCVTQSPAHENFAQAAQNWVDFNEEKSMCAAEAALRAFCCAADIEYTPDCDKVIEAVKSLRRQRYAGSFSPVDRCQEGADAQQEKMRLEALSRAAQLKHEESVFSPKDSAPRPPYSPFPAYPPRQTKSTKEND